MAKEQTRTEKAYQKGLERYDAEQAVAVAKERLEDAEKLLERVKAEHEALVMGTDTAEATTEAQKPKKERKPRRASADEFVSPDDDSPGVHPNVGSIYDIKASVLMFLRAPAQQGNNKWYSAGTIAKATGIDGKLVSKAIAQLVMSGMVRHNGGEKRGRAYQAEPLEPVGGFEGGGEGEGESTGD